MKSGWEITRTFLYRQRVGLSIVYALLATVACLILALKRANLPVFVPGDLTVRTGAWTFCCFALVMFIFLYVVATFVQIDADVLNPRSSYPAHFFTLPVKTWSLAFWPIAISFLTLGGTTYLFVLVLDAAGFPVSPLEITASLLACLATFQALFWSPMPFPFLRLILAVGTPIFVATIWILAETYHMDHIVPVYFLLGVALACGCLAGLAVRAARQEKMLTFSERRTRSKPIGEKAVSKPFRNAREAQLWYEWRQHARILPIVVAVAGFLFLVPLFFESTQAPLITSSGGLSMVHISAYVESYYPLLLAIPLIVAWIVGLGMRRSDLQPGSRKLYLFLETRPMTDFGLFQTKLLGALKSCAWAWGIVIALGLGILFLSKGHIEKYMPGTIRFTINGHFSYQAVANMTEGRQAPLIQLLLPWVSKAILWKVVAILCLCIFFTWRNYVTGLWIELSGYFELRYAYPMLLLAGAIGLGTLYGHFGYEAIEIILALALAGKLLLCGLLLRMGLKDGAFSLKQALGICAVYSVGVYVLTELANPSLWPNGIGDTKFYFYAPVLLALLYMPLTRILYASVALTRNRHA